MADRGRLIRVNRAIKVKYPAWAKRLLNPRLENTGPSSYDLNQVIPWIHTEQQGAAQVSGIVLFEFLKTSALIQTCLGLRDGEEIQKLGLAVYIGRFGSSTRTFLWRTVLQHQLGIYMVPCLQLLGRSIGIVWHPIEDRRDSREPALLFPSA